MLRHVEHTQYEPASLRGHSRASRPLCRAGTGQMPGRVHVLYTSRAIPQWCCKTVAGVAAPPSRRALRHGCRRYQMNLPLVVSWRWASCRSVPPGSALTPASAALPPHQNVRSPTHRPYAPTYIPGPAHCRTGSRQLRTYTAYSPHIPHILHSPHIPYIPRIPHGLHNPSPPTPRTAGRQTAGLANP
jgi:hypothetical protein